jgi:hypothetical protein
MIAATGTYSIQEKGEAMRKLAALAAVLVVATLSAAFGAKSASADYGNSAKYQVGFSLNCDNKRAPFCTSVVGLGGEWGWYAFNNDGTFDAQITFCGHSQGGSGAGHVDLDGIWMIGEPIDPPIWGQSSDFLISTDNGSTWQDSDIPATPGHYSSKPAPGISAVAQVAEIPGR